MVACTLRGKIGFKRGFSLGQPNERRSNPSQFRMTKPKNELPYFGERQIRAEVLHMTLHDINI